VPNEILEKLLKITQMITLDDVKAWKLLKFAVLPLMAILARSKACRQVNVSIGVMRMPQNKNIHKKF